MLTVLFCRLWRVTDQYIHVTKNRTHRLFHYSQEGQACPSEYGVDSERVDWKEVQGTR